ncbi:hypothetical protein ISN45_At05g012690 [Arabidopsis thaliana x Arabidopsis arenosa]|uniref:Uncharacterized protein n=2 Tax=Arabidopsis TaxID=3701 RepID=A0A8T2DPJ0_ARASU|nr:hypothetical protein ISN45_At05g012690 [Arabidopsis thaliana x Arabidopsis arenosa]KAG7609121.1 hypothetical protein ISN44_As05g012650 [Arabidopsis suecica]
MCSLVSLCISPVVRGRYIQRSRMVLQMLKSLKSSDGSEKGGDLTGRA